MRRQSAIQILMNAVNNFLIARNDRHVIVCIEMNLLGEFLDGFEMNDYAGIDDDEP